MDNCNQCLLYVKEINELKKTIDTLTHQYDKCVSIIKEHLRDTSPFCRNHIDRDSLLLSSIDDDLDELTENIIKNSLYEDINITDYKGDTPLYNAIENGKYEMVELLIKNNADMFHINNYGNNGILTAIEFEQPDIIELIFDNFDLKDYFEYKNKDGNTMLLAASNLDNIEIVKLIVKYIQLYKLDINALINQTNNDGKNALTITTDDEIITYLETYITN